MKKDLGRAHPWHGVNIGEKAPKIVNCYIEIVPTDVVKYELDKASGILKVDRPQRYSSQCPSLYGFVPQTYCGDRLGSRSAKVVGKKRMRGDGDPLDICVLTERPINHGDILVEAVPIGGLLLIDKDEADDKIIAVLESDLLYGSARDISDIPPALLDRIKHYFLSYKAIPGKKQPIQIAKTYGSKEAKKVIELSQLDYQELVFVK